MSRELCARALAWAAKARACRHWEATELQQPAGWWWEQEAAAMRDAYRWAAL